MSNRLNAAIADAYFKADIAAEQYATYEARQDKKEDLQLLVDQVNSEKDADFEADKNLSLGGSILGTAIGCLWGPVGCYAGYKLGQGAGSFIAGVTDSKEEIEALQLDIDEFDWSLDNLGNRYHALESRKWEDSMEAGSNTIADDIGDFVDDYYDPWYEDLIYDVAIPTFELYVGGSFTGADTAHSLYGGDFSKGLPNMKSFFTPSPEDSSSLNSEHWNPQTKKYDWEQ